MTSRISREPATLAAASAAGFLALTLYVELVGALPGEVDFLRWVYDHWNTNRPVADTQSFFAALGTPTVAVLITAVVAAVALVNAGRGGAALVVAAAAGTLLERPVAELVGLTDAAGENGLAAGGYPSGHVFFATSVFGAVAALGLRHRRREVAWVAALLIAGMGLSRATDRSHMVNEVLGGYLLGATWLFLLLVVSTGPRRSPTKRRT